MTVLPRAATAPELALFRTNGQWSKLSLFVYTPATVYSGIVSVLPTNGNDQARQIGYSSGSGTLGDVLPDMTMMIGTTAGGWDKGFCRVRSIDGSNVYIGETSEIAWAAGQYLTIVADWEIWLRKLSFMGGVYNLDNEIPYTTQYTDPIPQPVLGPYLAAVKLVSSTVTLAMDASHSWVPGGSVTGYAWAAKGPASVTFSSATASAPTLTFSAAGTYRISCTATTGTQTNTGYRLVHVYSAASPLAGGFVPGKVDISREAGGSFTVDLYDGSAISGVRPRALVALVAEDHYGDTIQSIGCVPGYENVVMIGRISGENITWNPEQSKATFTVQGPAGQLQAMPQWPFTLMDTHAVKTGASPLDADWLHMPELTVDKAAWCWANWRSTMGRCMDVYPSGDTRREYSAAGNLGSSWDQLRAFIDQIGGFPGVDRYGRMFVQVDPNLLSDSDRAAVPTVMDITKADWVDEIALERREYAVTGWMQTTGYIFNGSNFDAMLSAAPGNALGMRGNSQTKNNLLLSSQTQSNELAGLLLARANNEYPSATITLAGHNRLIDIAPAQYVTLTLAAGDTPYGVSFTSRKFIPKRVSYTYDPENGMFVVSLEAEAETTGPAGVTIIPPTVGIPNNPPTTRPPVKPPTWWPPYTGPPPVVLPPELPPNSACLAADLPTGPYDMWMGGGWLGNPDFYDGAFNRFPSTVRDSASSNKSQLEINGIFYKKVGGAWVETLDYGQFVATAENESTPATVTAVNSEPTTSRQRIAVFEPAADTPVNLYRIASQEAGFTPMPTANATYWFGTGVRDLVISNLENWQQQEASGLTHYWIAYNYSFYGDLYVQGKAGWFSPGISFTVPDATEGEEVYLRAQCIITAVPQGPGTVYCTDARDPYIQTGVTQPYFCHCTSYYWRAIHGSVAATVNQISGIENGGLTAEGTWIGTANGQYFQDRVINLQGLAASGLDSDKPVTGMVIFNLWMGHNDATEYQATIDSVYLRNVCPL